MTPEERLEKLERELTGLKERTRWLLFGIVAILPVGLFVAWVYTVGRVSVVEGGESGTFLGMTADGPALQLFDELGRSRVVLMVTADGPALSLFDQNAQLRAELHVSSTQGGATLSLLDAAGTERATLGTTALTPLAGGGATTLPESSLLFSGPDGGVVWQAPEPVP